MANELLAALKRGDWVLREVMNAEDAPHRLDDLSPQAAAQRQGDVRALAQEFGQLTPEELGSLPMEDQILAAAVRQQLTRFWNDEAVSPRKMDPTWGYWQPYYIGSVTHPMESEADLEALLDLYRSVPAHLAQHEQNLRDGKTQGFVAPALVIQSAVQELEGFIAPSRDESPFMNALSRSSWTGEQRQGAADLLWQVVQSDVLPALRRHRDFLADEIVGRETTGVSALPDGRNLYRGIIQANTDLPLSADEVHALGLAEVERLAGAMIATAGLPVGSSLREAIDAVAARPDASTTDANAYLDYARRLLGRAQENLPAAFGLDPASLPPVEIVEVDMNGGAYYEEPRVPGGPGLISVGTGGEVLSLEDVAPTDFHEYFHHLQLTNAESLPPLLAQTYTNATVEGAALYVETLADELGMYETDLEKFGYLANQMLRAARLVIDTGLHDRGWDFETATRYMTDNTPLTREEAEQEIVRYIATPGQALGYMIGQKAIQSMRQQLEREQGSAFDLSAFHRALLQESIPLTGFEILFGVRAELAEDVEALAA